MLRRPCASSVARIVGCAQARSIWTIWHTTSSESVVTKGTPVAQLMTNSSGLRHTTFKNTPLLDENSEYAAVLKTMSGPEAYLLSAVVDDLRRLGGIDWTYEFDSFWHDRVLSHEALFDTIYNGKGGFLVYIMGNRSSNAAAKAAVSKELNKLRSMLKWADETERRYSAMAKARFTMQREVFESLEREKILAGCVESYEDFVSAVPSEYKRKASQELGWHLGNMRHWVWDCPNAKRDFPRTLA